MVRIALMGIQSSGKGTLGSRLAKELRVPHVVIGELLRQRATVDDDIGRQVAARQAEGKFADEAVVVQVLAERLADAPAGFVLDGFPRFGKQVDTLDAMLQRLGTRLDAPVHLKLSEADARGRIMNRLVCSRCGHATSRLYDEEGGSCPANECSGTLAWRSDDRNPQAVETRIAEFKQHTLPVIESYRRSGRLIEVDVATDSESAYDELRQALLRLRGQSNG